MILTLAIIVRLCFKNASFVLDQCELTDEHDKVRTVFSTTGITRWGAHPIISGVDHFWLSDDPNGVVTIVRHQSEWHQSGSEIWHSFITPHYAAGVGS